MYFSIAIFIFFLLFLFVFSTCRRRWAIKKVCSMNCAEKCRLFSSLIEPFGYCYDSSQDIISSRNDAWQRETGYTSLFDRAAALFNMVFDSLPVYFNYGGRTWLIELWKGQYGINTGAETGIYYAKRIIPKEELSTAHFQAVEDKDMLSVSMSLETQERLISHTAKKTWWLTSFSMGMFSKPSQLCLTTCLCFPNCDMMYSFLNALHQTEIPNQNIQICGLKVCLLFDGSSDCSYSLWQRIIRSWAQFWNRIFCKIYLFITRYFKLTMDRLLYLYYLLPFAFRRIMRLRRYNNHKPHCKNTNFSHV